MHDQSILTHVEKIMKNNVKKCHKQQKCKIYVAIQRTYDIIEILYGNYSDTRCPNSYHFSYIFCYIQLFSLFLLRIDHLYDCKLKINRTFHLSTKDHLCVRNVSNRQNTSVGTNTHFAPLPFANFLNKGDIFIIYIVKIYTYICILMNSYIDNSLGKYKFWIIIFMNSYAKNSLGEKNIESLQNHLLCAIYDQFLIIRNMFYSFSKWQTSPSFV